MRGRENLRVMNGGRGWRASRLGVVFSLVVVSIDPRFPDLWGPIAQVWVLKLPDSLFKEALF